MEIDSEDSAAEELDDIGDVSNEELAEWCSQLKDENIETRKAAVRKARVLASSDVYQDTSASPLQRLIDLQFIPPLKDCLDDPCEAIQMEAVWALSNIASGTSEQTQAVADSGAVPALVKLVSSDNQNIAEQALWALDNISGDGCQGRDLVLSHGALEAVLLLLKDGLRQSFLEMIVWFLLNMYRKCEDNLSDDIIQRTLPILSVIVTDNRCSVEVDIVWTCIHLMRLGERHIQMIVDSGIIPAFIHKLEASTRIVQSTVLEAIGAIFCHGNAAQVKLLLDKQVVEAIRACMDRGVNLYEKSLVALNELLENNAFSYNLPLKENVLRHLLGTNMCGKVFSSLCSPYMNKDGLTESSKFLGCTLMLSAYCHKVSWLIEVDYVSNLLMYLPNLHVWYQERLLTDLAMFLIFPDITGSEKQKIAEAFLEENGKDVLEQLLKKTTANYPLVNGKYSDDMDIHESVVSILEDTKDILTYINQCMTLKTMSAPVTSGDKSGDAVYS